MSDTPSTAAVYRSALHLSMDPTTVLRDHAEDLEQKLNQEKTKLSMWKSKAAELTSKLNAANERIRQLTNSINDLPGYLAAKDVVRTDAVERPDDYDYGITLANIRKVQKAILEP